MKITTRFISIVLVLLYLTACSGITVSEDYDETFNFSSLKTFSWLPKDKNEYGVKGNDLVEKRFITAIESNLSKSFSQINSGKPDFYISYHVTVKRKVSTSNVSGGVSMGRSSRGRYGSVGMSTGTQVNVFNEGTLLIDVIETQSNKLIWRGISTQSVSDHLKAGESAEIINETVEKMLAQFPPKK